MGGGKSIYMVKLTGWGAELGKGLTGHIQDATRFHAAGRLVAPQPFRADAGKRLPRETPSSVLDMLGLR